MVAPSASQVCAVLAPIRWSIGDTIPTQKQVIHYNAVRDSLCGKNQEPPK